MLAAAMSVPWIVERQSSGVRGEHPEDEADGHEGGAEAEHESRCEPNGERSERVAERGGTGIAGDEAG